MRKKKLLQRIERLERDQIQLEDFVRWIYAKGYIIWGKHEENEKSEE